MSSLSSVSRRESLQSAAVNAAGGVVSKSVRSFGLSADTRASSVVDREKDGRAELAGGDGSPGDQSAPVERLEMSRIRLTCGWDEAMLTKDTDRWSISKTGC